MSLTLERCGLPMHTFTGQRCAAHGHPLRAEEMKTWLASAAAWPYLPDQVEIHKRVTWRDFEDRSGSCVWRNFYGNNGQGDHVDLWNGTEVAVGNRDYFGRSQEVWFWHIP